MRIGVRLADRSADNPGGCANRRVERVAECVDKRACSVLDCLLEPDLPGGRTLVRWAEAAVVLPPPLLSCPVDPCGVIFRELAYPAWQRALAADRPTVLDVHTDPNVPPIPPHATFEQMKDAAEALLKGDENRWAIVGEGIKTKVQEFLPHKDD